MVPGASVAKIALDHLLNANLLFKWRCQQLRELAQAAPKPAAELLPVTVVEPEGTPVESIVDGAHQAGFASGPELARLPRREEDGLQMTLTIILAAPAAFGHFATFVTGPQGPKAAIWSARQFCLSRSLCFA